MEIWMIAGVLFVIALALFVYSLIKKEERDLAYKELEEFSLSMTQTVYDLNERVYSLENELNITSPVSKLHNQVTALTTDNIITLFTRGVSASVISKQLGVEETSVQHIIDTYISEGI